MTLQSETRGWFHKIAVALLCVTTVAGCTASKVPFQYTPAYVPADEIPPPWRNAAVSVIDQRSDRSLDETITPAIDLAVGEALAAEIRTAGFASEASFGNHPADASIADLRSQGVDAQCVATLQDLRWEIVDYEGLQTTAFAVGLLFGLIGVLVMSATHTDVDGHAKIDIRWTDLNSGTSFQKSFVGHCEKEYPTFSSDQPEARAQMSACAFELAMRELRTELETFAATLPSPPAVAAEP